MSFTPSYSKPLPRQTRNPRFYALMELVNILALKSPRSSTDNCIQRETTNPEEQFGNGKAETLVGAIGRGMRTALLSSNLPVEFWGFAAQNWIDVYNHHPHTSLDFKTPFEAEMGTTPTSPGSDPLAAESQSSADVTRSHITSSHPVERHAYSWVLGAAKARKDGLPGAHALSERMSHATAYLTRPSCPCASLINASSDTMTPRRAPR
jgi:hypothetical protein